MVVHGDLWSGNRGRGTIGADGGVEDVIFDPSSCYAHSEYEFGIMGMFGGFGSSFNAAYWKVKPRDHPVEEWEDRQQLYELYVFSWLFFFCPSFSLLSYLISEFCRVELIRVDWRGRRERGEGIWTGLGYKLIRTGTIILTITPCLEAGIRAVR